MLTKKQKRQMSKILYSKIIPPKGFVAINLFGLIVVRKGFTLTKASLNHEKIHTRQMIEMLFLLFYLWYVIEYLIRLIQYKGAFLEAYRNISFEREAYAMQNDLQYIKHRKIWAWIFFLQKTQMI